MKRSVAKICRQLERLRYDNLHHILVDNNSGQFSSVSKKEPTKHHYLSRRQTWDLMLAIFGDRKALEFEPDYLGLCG